MRPKVLIVDDEPYMLELIQTIIDQGTSCQTWALSDPLEVIPLVEREDFNIVFLDLRMPGMDGMELLEKIKKHRPETDLVIVTAYGTIPSAVEAMQQGAADYITKPFNKKQILLVTERILRWQALQQENLALRQALEEKYDFSSLVGGGERMQEIYDQVEKLAATDVPIYLEGEMGTGKTFMAKALHYHHRRSQEPFISLTCSTLPQDDLAGALFGVQQGPQDRKKGLLGQAHGGTLYLADIHTMPLPLQGRLAQFLDSGQYQVEGSSEVRRADVRLLGSSDQSLRELAAKGLMDQRLYFHLAKFPLLLPPLRARREDIPVLVGKFIKKYRTLYDKPVERVSDEALKWLLSRDWPGNIRELENTVERAVVLSQGPTIELSEIYPSDYLNSFIYSADPSLFDLSRKQALEKGVASFRRSLDLQYVSHCLARFRGDLERAAAHMGLTPQALQAKAARLNLSPESFRRGL